MIIREKTESYDGSFRILMYEADDQGKLQEKPRKSDLDDQIETFYSQRQLEMDRLKSDVLSGRISPISLLMAYQQLTLPDLASRVKLSKRKVQKHLTPAGFRTITVEILQRYARVFDVTVADFFQFMLVKEGANVATSQKSERLYQLVDVFPEETAENDKDDHAKD